MPASVHRNPVALDIRDFGAKQGDSAFDNTNAFNAAIQAAAANRGGAVYVPMGTWWVTGPIILKTGVSVIGSNRAGTVVRLAANSGNNVFETEGFDGLTGTSSPLGAFHWSVERLTVHGNRANNTAGGGIWSFGKAWMIHDVRIIECSDTALYSEWGSGGGTDMESQVIGLHVEDCDKAGIYWDGPHDSHLSNIIVAKCGEAATNTYDGVTFINPEGAGCQVVNAHVWGNDHRWAWYIRADGFTGVNVTGEGAATGQLYLGAGRFNVTTAHFFKAAGGTIAVKLGDTGIFPSFGMLDAKVSDCETALDVASDSGFNFIRLLVDSTTGDGTGWINSPSGLQTSTCVMVLAGDGVTSTSERSGLWAFPGEVRIPDGIRFLERSDPSAPPANHAVLYSKDNGSGKTQLVVRFPTGAVQVIATEP